MNKNETKINLPKRWAPLILLVLLIGGIYASGIHQSVTLESLQNHKDDIADYVATHKILAPIFFIALYIASVALSLPIATLLTLLGGFLFGRWFGTFYVVLGATVGAVIIFLIARSSIGATLREKAGALYQKIENNMNENAVSYLLFLRLVPLFPFFVVNIVPALFNVSLRIYILTTFFGILPGSFIYVNLGQALGAIDTLDDLVTYQTFLAFGLLGLFALIPTLYKQFKKRKARVRT